MSSGQTLALIHPQSPWPGVQFFCTTRAGGVGRVPFATFNLGMGVGDNVATVAENRRRLRQVVPAEPYWLRQVHGWRVMDADAGVGPQSATAPGAVSTQQGVVPPEADAAITTQPGRVLAILTADCLPVVLADTEGRVLGVAHAGWRGLAGGVLEATLQAMRERCPEARAWRAWIGPGIGASAFQVGDDVREAFAGVGAELPGMFTADTQVTGKWRADLAGLARWRLVRLGVENIEICGLCTATDAAGRFYSYRRDGQTGRMATLAWIQADPQSS